MTSLVVRKEILGGVGVLKPQRTQIICPACGLQVEAIAADGRVKGYCTVARQSVDFLVETQLEKKNDYRQDPEYRAKLSAGVKQRWQDPEYRAKQTAAQTGKYHTAEARAKMSAAWHNNNNDYRQAPEYRAKQSAGLKQRWQDPEYRAKQIAAKTGKHLTAETRAKISATWRNKIG